MRDPPGFPELTPAAGFEWSRVTWVEAPAPAAPTCSYCDAPIGAGELTMQLAARSGLRANFCEACQWDWWGIERLA